ncbi:hypothetical protein [Bacillus cereus]|uniref:hypothetical protein n=1 Tax=Bacillus cereus TaxID=1396 RepID=UPI0015D4808E|nr:hypothetical protein [Bacillus cereus]MDZ4422656.1 hypothetical protein [Bacillus cereus]UDW09533.1 hypothetical protein FHP23_029695 [Bacillus cereus]
MKNENCCIGMESIEKRNKVKAIALCDVRKQIKICKIKALHLQEANKEQSHE